MNIKPERAFRLKRVFKLGLLLLIAFLSKLEIRENADEAFFHSLSALAEKGIFSLRNYSQTIGDSKVIPWSDRRLITCLNVKWTDISVIPS